MRELGWLRRWSAGPLVRYEENWAGIKLPIALLTLTVKSNRKERNRTVKHRNAASEWIERQSLPSFMLPCAYLLRAGEPRGVVSG